jgi:hypothetical protein
MVSIHDGRLLLAKSRRLLVTSKRLFQDLESGSLAPNNAAGANPQTLPKNRSGRRETKLELAGVDGNPGPYEAEHRQDDVDSESWNRPRKPR